MPQEKDYKQLADLLKELVDIYSPSGKEKTISSYIYDYVSAAGLRVERQAVDDNRENLIIVPENDSAQVVFVGHIDTVVAPDYANYKFNLEEDTAYGLGTADMKGGCAALIQSFIAFKEQVKEDVPAALALVVGEEENGDGAWAFVEEYHFPWAIVAEPTNLKPCFSHCGYMELELTTTGKRMHASVAQNEYNAIRTMLRILGILTNFLENERSEVIYNIRDMQSSQAGFATPDKCTAAVDLHVPPHFEIGKLVYELEEQVEHIIKDPALLHELLVFSTLNSGYTLPAKGFIPDIIESVFNQQNIPYEESTFQSDSDASILWQAGIKPVILGPGQLLQAHAVDESVQLKDVFSAFDLYFGILQNLRNQ